MGFICFDMGFVMSNVSDLFGFHLKANKVNGFVSEYKFHPTRKWRFDWANPEIMIAAECEGGVYSGGRHTRGKGYTNDCIKYNHAVALGWDVYRFPTELIKSGEAINFILQVLPEKK